MRLGSPWVRLVVPETSTPEVAVGLIHVDEFETLDGVAQAPGGPDEDRDGGFRFGGWQAPLTGAVDGAAIGEGLAGLDALLLGRRTYDVFAAYWPTAPAEPDGDIAALFNRIPKYVASRGAPRLDWAGSRLLGPDLAAAVHEIRDRHENVHVIGSLDLVRSLLAEGLVDRLHLFVYPVLLGQGKRALQPGIAPANLRLLAPPQASEKGAIVLHYAVEPGTPGTGDMSTRT
jgi:dihydrofolate reductase